MGTSGCKPVATVICCDLLRFAQFQPTPRSRHVATPT
jgi:hypothetical protein